MTGAEGASQEAPSSFGGNVALTDRDLAAFAARIRPHFESELRELAEHLALRYAHLVGSRVKDLRPETTIDEIASWPRTPDSILEDLAYSEIELLLALEDLQFVTIPRALKELRASGTFGDLVLWHARQRRAA